MASSDQKKLYPLLKTAGLLELAKAGDLGAQAELINLYTGKLRSLILFRARPGSPARWQGDTEDFLQEVRMRALAGLHSFEYRGIGSFWLWIRQIAIHCISDSANKKAARSNIRTIMPESQEEPPASQVAPYEGLIKKEQIILFDRALSLVPEMDRQLLTLRLELNLPFQAIAEECGFSSDSAARIAYKRALLRLVKLINYDK